MHYGFWSELPPSQEVIGILENVGVDPKDVCRIEWMGLAQFQHAANGRLAWDRAIVALQAEMVKASQCLLFPINPDWPAHRLAQTVRSFDHILRAGDAAGRQKNAMDAPQGHLGRHKSFPF